MMSIADKSLSLMEFHLREKHYSSDTYHYNLNLVPSRNVQGLRLLKTWTGIFWRMRKEFCEEMT